LATWLPRTPAGVVFPLDTAANAASTAAMQSFIGRSSRMRERAMRMVGGVRIEDRTKESGELRRLGFT
jgi:hypothetical protein